MGLSNEEYAVDDEKILNGSLAKVTDAMYNSDSLYFALKLITDLNTLDIIFHCIFLTFNRNHL